MSKVVTTTVAPTQPGDTVTLGGTGDSVVITNNDIRTNVLQDAGGNAIFTSDGSGTLSGLNSGLSGDAWELLNTTNASNSASVSFTSLTGYKIFKFVFIDVNPATDSVRFSFQVNASGGSGFNETITSSFFYAYQNETATATALMYQGSYDQAQGTSYQPITGSVGNASDECAAGELFLFNPASTTFVKHFYSRLNHYDPGNYTVDAHVGGYINTTTNLSEISFKASSGNLDAVIKQYGLVAT